MRSTTVILLSSLLASCGGTQYEKPPVAVEVKVAVPVACQEEVPQCQAPAYDAASPEMAIDQKVQLMRVEMKQQADCVRRYDEALERCRAPLKTTTVPPSR